MIRLRIVTEKTNGGWWRVRVVVSNWSAVSPGWELETCECGVFYEPSGYSTNFPSRYAARERLKQYISMHPHVKITGGLH